MEQNTEEKNGGGHGECCSAHQRSLGSMSLSMAKARTDCSGRNPLCSCAESARETVAEYPRRLAAFGCISVPERLERCVGKYPEKLWVKIPNYFCLRDLRRNKIPSYVGSITTSHFGNVAERFQHCVSSSRTS